MAVIVFRRVKIFFNFMQKLICHNAKKEEFEISVDQLTWRPSAYGVLIEDEKILLSCQFGGYDYPGGGMNINETVSEALKREFFEETGIIIEPVRPIYCGTSFFNPSHSLKNKDKFWNCVLIYYLVKRVGGKLTADNLDDEEKSFASLAQWVDIKTLKNIKFYNEVDNNGLIEAILNK